MLPPDAVTWVGHSTVLIELDGRRVLTDPVLTNRVAHLRRRRPLRLDRHHHAAGLTDVDVVAVSHVHMDHLHVRSLRSIGRRAHLVVPAGSASLVRPLGFDSVTEMSIGDELDLDGIVVRAFPAEHKRARGPHSSVEADPMGFVVAGTRSSAYFAGDTDLFDRMAELAGVTVALLPIWGWGPTIGTGHLDPGRAVEATKLLDPSFVVPIHWGTLSPEDGRRRTPSWLDEPAVEFRTLLAASPLADRLRLLLPGGRLELPAPS